MWYKPETVLWNLNIQIENFIITLLFDPSTYHMVNQINKELITTTWDANMEKI